MIESADFLRLLEQADIKFTTESGNTLLHAACDKGLECVKKCLDLGADVNAQTKQFETPLSWAIINGNIKMARALIDNGADLTVKKYGINFLHIAARSNEPGMLLFLLRYRPKMKDILFQKADSGFNVLHFAAKYNSFKVANYLILEGLDLFETDNKGYIPMHIACMENAYTTIILLLRLGPDTQLGYMNNKEETPLDVAVGNTKKRVRRLKGRLQGYKKLDKCTGGRYRFGLAQHFPCILVFICFHKQQLC
eukprot:UN29125